MTTIELHPEGSGSPIVGEWQGVGATYLVGRSGGMCWSPKIQSGDMPIAVFSTNETAVCVAPVHPLCHVSAEGQVVTSITSGETLQLGVDKYKLKIVRPRAWQRRLRMALIVGVIIGVALVGGWCLRGSLSGPSVATSSDLYTF